MTVTKALHLSKPQIKKLVSGGSFRLSPHGISKNAVRVNVRLPEKVYNSVKQAHSMGRSGTITGGAVVGGKVNVGKAFKKAGRSLGNVAKKVRQVMPKAARAVGKVAQQVKKKIPKQLVSELASEAVSAGLLATGNPQLIPAARVAVQSGVDATYDTNLGKGSVGKNFARNFGKSLVSNGVASMTGGGVRNHVRGGSISGPHMDSYRDQTGGRFLALQANQTGSYLPGSVSGRGFMPLGSGFLPLG